MKYTKRATRTTEGRWLLSDIFFFHGTDTVNQSNLIRLHHAVREISCQTIESCQRLETESYITIGSFFFFHHLLYDHSGNVYIAFSQHGFEMLFFLGVYVKVQHTPILMHLSRCD